MCVHCSQSQHATAPPTTHGSGVRLAYGAHFAPEDTFARRFKLTEETDEDATADAGQVNDDRGQRRLDGAISRGA
jgi:hypothetical protein